MNPLRLTSTPVPAIAANQLSVFLLQCALLLLLALLLGRTAARLGMPAVVGELLAGVLLGPSLLGWVAPSLSAWLLPQRTDQFHLLDSVGQLSVVLLVGITGMQMDLTRIRGLGATAARVSSAGLIVPLVAGIACGFFLPASILVGHERRLLFALFLGVALCVSAIPVIAKTMIDMGLLHRTIGQLALAAGMIDDAVGWLLLSVVSAMATSGLGGEQLLLAVLKLAFVVAVALTLGRLLVGAAVTVAARSPDSDLVSPVVVAVLLLGAAATQALGLEAILGSFLCGILIVASGRIERMRLAGLRSVVARVLAPLFFATVGLRIDLTALARPPVLATAAVVLTVAVLGKFGGAWLGAWTSRLSPWEAMALGGAMNARGVIQLVVASIGLRLGVVGTDAYTVIVLVAIATSLMAAPVLKLAMTHVDEADLHRAEARA